MRYIILITFIAILVLASQAFNIDESLAKCEIKHSTATCLNILRP